MNEYLVDLLNGQPCGIRLEAKDLPRFCGHHYLSLAMCLELLRILFFLVLIFFRAVQLVPRAPEETKQAPEGFGEPLL